MDHVKINVEDAAEDSLRFRTSGTCAAMYMYSTSSCMDTNGISCRSASELYVGGRLAGVVSDDAFEG